MTTRSDSMPRAMPEGRGIHGAMHTHAVFHDVLDGDAADRLRLSV